MLLTLCDRNGLNTDPSKSWWSGRSRWSGVSRDARLAISSSRSKISLGKKETLRESHVTNSQMEWKTSRIVFLCRQRWCLIYSTLSWNYFLCLDFPIKNLIFFFFFTLSPLAPASPRGPWSPEGPCENTRHRATISVSTGSKHVYK